MAVMGGIHGVVLSGTVPNEPPIILVIAREKTGKSSLACSLMGWHGGNPLVLAFDPTGPDSCARLGYQVPNVKIKDAPGNTFVEKAINVITNVEQSFRNRGAGFPFTSIVIDCASTMSEMLFQHFQAANPGVKDPRQIYGNVLDVSRQYFFKLTTLSVPTIWIAWLKEPFTEEKGSGPNKTRVNVEGGPQITGSFKNILAGKATNIILLDKEKHGTNAPGADEQGYVRMFHTKPYNNINCAGRFALPEPCPAHLGYVLDTIMGQGQMAPAAAIADQQVAAR